MTDILRVGDEPAPLRRVLAKPTHLADRRQTADRFKTINTFCDVTLAGLSRAEFAVWLLLWRDTKPTGIASTSQADLARRAGVDARTVRRALRQLSERGLIVVVHRGGIRQGASIYRVRPAERPP